MYYGLTTPGTPTRDADRAQAVGSDLLVRPKGTWAGKEEPCGPRRLSVCREGGWGAFEGKGPQRRFDRRFDRRLEEVAKAVAGGYCRLHHNTMPLKLALGIGWVPWKGWAGTCPRSNASLEGGIVKRYPCEADPGVPTGPPQCKACPPPRAPLHTHQP